MNEFVGVLNSWVEQGKRVALATVVRTWGSAPRGVGAQMGVNENGEMIGSVSGGCVEGAVVEAAQQVLVSGVPQMLNFGVADETAWEVGLACGGKIDVFVRPLEMARLETVAAELEAGRDVVTVTVLRGPSMYIGWEAALLADGLVTGEVKHAFQEAVIAAGRQARPESKSETANVTAETGEQGEVLIQVHHPPPMLVVVGGVHITMALVDLANTLGYRTVVVDPRRAFGSRARFERADLLLQEWPDKALPKLALTKNTAVAMLTHDPKIDDPALEIVLRSPVFYIGALGSLRTQEKRRARLRAQGFAEEELARIHGPIGLDLGGRAPEEIALAVLAEIVQVRNGSGRRV